jgi:hypothetical protein
LNAAYAVAQAGDRIYVRAGTYGDQTIAGRSLGSSTVTIAKDPAASSVTLESLTDRASYVVLDGFTVSDGIYVDVTGSNCTGNQCPFDTHDVTVRNFWAPHAVIRASRVTFQHGEIGPYSACAGVAAGGPEDGLVISGLGPYGGPFTPADHVTIDDVSIHDILWNGSCSNHTDAIQSFSSRNLTIENSHIWNGETSLLIAYSFDDSDPSQVDNMVIENNEFGSVRQVGHGLSIGDADGTCGQSGGILVENNVFYGNVDADSNCQNSVFRNNVVMDSQPCANWGGGEVWSWAYNVFANPGSFCDSTNKAKVCTPSFVDPNHSDGNADVTANDPCVKSAADPSNYPATDIHGKPRPQGSGPDAGANEVG